MSDATLEKELKKPDEFVGFFGKIAQNLLAHSRKVLVFTSIAFTVGVFALGIWQWRKTQNLKAANDLSEILKAYPSLYQTHDFPKASWEDLLKKLDEFSMTHSSSSLTAVAGLHRAQILMKLGRFEEALAQYDKVSRRLSGPYGAIAKEGMAYALVEQKKWAEAEKIWKELSERSDNPMAADHLWNLAQVQESEGAKERAIETYQRFETKFPSAPQLDKVRERLSSLKGE